MRGSLRLNAVYSMDALGGEVHWARQFDESGTDVVADGALLFATVTAAKSLLQSDVVELNLGDRFVLVREEEQVLRFGVFSQPVDRKVGLRLLACDFSHLPRGLKPLWESAVGVDESIEWALVERESSRPALNWYQKFLFFFPLLPTRIKPTNSVLITLGGENVPSKAAVVEAQRMAALGETKSRFRQVKYFDFMFVVSTRKETSNADLIEWVHKNSWAIHFAK